jgi:hypothetical protein
MRIGYLYNNFCHKIGEYRSRSRKLYLGLLDISDARSPLRLELPAPSPGEKAWGVTVTKVEVEASALDPGGLRIVKVSYGYIRGKAHAFHQLSP